MNKPTTINTGLALLILVITVYLPACKNVDYTSIHDARDWQNPFLVVQRDGVSVTARGGSQTGSQMVSIDKLANYLDSLPEKAWPYGKIVGLQEIGIRSGDDDKFIERNKTETVRILNSLGIEFNWWPSA